MPKHIMHSAAYVICFLAVFTLSCKKSSIDSDTDPAMPGNPYPIPAASPVQGSVSGRVVDANLVGVAGATVECAGTSITTDANGFFNINNVNLDRYISTVTVTKQGYFKAYRSFSATASRNLINIKLIPKTLAGTFTATTAGTITLSNSTEIKFQPNSIKSKSTGAAFSGDVRVYASYIDPTADDFSASVPGSLMARDANNMYVLKSFGMIAVELESQSGEALQLMDALPASIKLPIPASLTADAPQTINTWSLDDQGVWKSEATATRAGNYYILAATHFSFWNCDVPMNAVYLNMHIQDLHDSPVANLYLQLKTITNSPSESFGITDINGNVSGFVPANTGLELSYLPDPGCFYNFVFMQNIVPLSTNTSMTINFNWPLNTTMQVLNISGIANDCFGQPIANGYAYVISGSSYSYTSITNGVYNMAFMHCGSITSITVYLSDNIIPVVSLAGTYNITGTTITIPPAAICINNGSNNYQGVYEVTGSYYDVSNASFTALYPKKYILTSPAFINSVVVADSSLGDIGYVFQNAGSSTFYGSFGLQVTFDPVSNVIIDLHNYYGDPNNPATPGGNPASGSGPPLYSASNGRRAVLDPSGINAYDPVTRTVRIRYWMYHPSVVPSGPRAYFDETWTYLHP